MPVRFPKEMSPREIQDLEDLLRQERPDICIQIIKLYSKYMEDTRKAREQLAKDIDKLLNHWPNPPSSPDETNE